MAARRTVCVLASGGMDSAVLLGEALRGGNVVRPVYVRCGLLWERAELHWLRKFLRAVRSPRLKPLEILSLPVKDLYGRHWSLGGRPAPGYVSRDEEVCLPGRNVLLLAKTAALCARRGADEIWIGALKGNPFPDSTPRFLKKAAAAFSDGLGRRIRIRAPFLKLSKTRVMDLGRGLPLRLTFSCLAPRGTAPCGRCNKCAERDKVLRGNLLS